MKATAEMARTARRALAWREKYGRGGTSVGVARARDIANRRTLSCDTKKRMRSYFARHAIDKKAVGFRNGEKGFPSAGRIAWDLWGGDPGERWAKTMAKRNPSKSPREMTNSQINARLDALDKQSSKMTDQLIEAGRGHEKISETVKKTDPLSVRYKKILDETMSLRIEAQQRYGPGFPGRLPRQVRRRRNPTMAKRKATPAQLRALAKGRAALKKARAKARRRNPGPPTRGAVMARDLPGLTKGTGQRRMTQQREISRKLKTYPRAKPNPPHYVIKGPRGYFDGAGWASTKTGAAQFITKKKAASIAQKVANATNKPVSVVAV